MKTATTISVSDAIREHVQDKYVKAALRTGQQTFIVNVGEVHRALKLRNRVPQVCAALQSKKLVDENRLRIVSKTGPPSGQSTTVTFTYEVLSQEPKRAAAKNPLMELRGIGKEIFKELGGGEAFIRSERQNFSEQIEKQMREEQSDTV